jgi:hypothetical protein
MMCSIRIYMHMTHFFTITTEIICRTLYITVTYMSLGRTRHLVQLCQFSSLGHDL